MSELLTNLLANEKNRAYESSDGRLSIVPGKLVLAQLFSWVKETYGVSINTGRIAVEMQLNEIPEELRKVLTAIEKNDVIMP